MPRRQVGIVLSRRSSTEGMGKRERRRGEEEKGEEEGNERFWMMRG